MKPIDALKLLKDCLHTYDMEPDMKEALSALESALAAPPCVDVDKNILNPDMPAQEMRLHMGELTSSEMLVARAAIRWANSLRPSDAPADVEPKIVTSHFHGKEMPLTSVLYALAAQENNDGDEGNTMQAAADFIRNLIRTEPTDGGE